jgi:ubiquinone/menaquinone biosynthesis C-methylase UbiE
MMAAIFDWLHGAAFYRQFHRDAAGLLPRGVGRNWLDVGCGPGVLPREAAARGYSVRAVDRQRAMIEAAIRKTRGFPSKIDFAVSDLEAESATGNVYDVVSASSLLTVLPDPRAGLARLAALAKPGGAVLIIEATDWLTPTSALRLLARNRLGARSSMLLVWAMARMGRAAPALAPYDPGLSVSVTPLLEGFVEATVFRKRRM